MRVGVKVGLGLSALVAFSMPAAAKECVEPYGELVQVSEFEMAVRVKPECEALHRTAAALEPAKPSTEVTLGSAVLVADDLKTKSSLLPALPDSSELSPRRMARREVSCSDPAVCGRRRVAAAEKPFDCEDGRGYTVGISSGLAEVHIIDKCRHLMNPKSRTVSASVPHVLAPDWELDATKEPRRARRFKSQSADDCIDPAGCGEVTTGKSARPKPVEQPSSGAIVIGRASFGLDEWRMADVTYSRDTGLLATRNRRMPSELV